ncbi:MAG: hypothetical protein AAFQ88_05015 [Pseudomonadota bacterium]
MTAPLPKVGIVCGLAGERTALGPLGDDPQVTVTISGARPAVAEDQARALAAAGCRVLVSWGLAGGLVAGLEPGDLIAPRHVIDEQGVERPLAPVPLTLAGKQPARLLGAERVIMTPAEKTRLAETLGAAAVDMETHRVARAAAAAGLPCLALRAIGDPADRALPGLAAEALGPDGKPQIGTVLGGLLRKPGDLPALMRAKSDSDAGFAALRKAAEGLRHHLASL